ncbi:MAG: tetratricopeptide repeat protein [Proteobacteria bacterium]|nr:tetratricopeptide repeat protein [Pseudomonadota bacterium]
MSLKTIMVILFSFAFTLISFSLVSAQDNYCPEGYFFESFVDEDQGDVIIRRAVCKKNAVPLQLDSRSYDVVTGQAFTKGPTLIEMIEDTNWPIEAKANFVLGVLMAGRGRYDQAISYFQAALKIVPNEPWITATIDEFRGLQAEAAVKEGFGSIAKGMVDPATLGGMPKAARDRIMIAMSLVDVGDFSGAIGLLNEAKGVVPTDQDLMGAQIYVRQLVIQKRERESPLSDQEKAQIVAATRERGRLDAALKLGFHADENGDRRMAIFFYQEVQKGLSTDSFMHSILDELIKYPGNPEPNMDFPNYGSKADAILSALQYGNGNWSRSILYLEAAFNLDPSNLFIRDALNYVQGMSVYGEQDGE